MDFTEITIDKIADIGTSLEDGSINKHDILDAIYTDTNIFSTKHPSMQGYSTAKSYMTNMISDVASYKRPASDGYFFVNQCGRALAIARVADAELSANMTTGEYLTKEFELLEAEAAKIAQKHYKDRLVMQYRIIPLALTDKSGYCRATGETCHEDLDVWKRTTPAAGTLPILIFFPVYSITDLTYPMDLAIGEDVDRATFQNRRDTVVNSKNYTGLNLNNAFVNAWIAFLHSDSDTALSCMRYSDNRHPLQALLFLEKQLVKDWLSGDKSDIVDYLASAREQYPLDTTHGIFLSYEDYRERTHRYNNDKLAEDVMRKASARTGSVIIGSKQAIATLWDVKYNNISVMPDLAKYDHILRKENSKGLCDECPYKLLCLLDNSGANSPENVNVCRSVAVVRGLKELEKKYGLKLLKTRKVYTSVPTSASGKYLTRKGLAVIANYALDSNSESSPEDWLLSNAAMGLAAAMGRDDYYKIAISRARYNRVNTGTGVSGLVFLEEVIGTHTKLLNAPIKKHELSPVRPSNNSHDENSKIVWLVLDSDDIIPARKRLLDELLSAHGHYDMSIARKRAADMMELLFNKPVNAIYDTTALCENKSLLSEYTDATILQETLLKSGNWLKLNTKLIENLSSTKADLYSLLAASLSEKAVQNQGLLSICGESELRRFMASMKQAVTNSRDMVAAGKSILANIAATQHADAVVPQEREVATLFSLMSSIFSKVVDNKALFKSENKSDAADRLELMEVFNTLGSTKWLDRASADKTEAELAELVLTVDPRHVTVLFTIGAALAAENCSQTEFEDIIAFIIAAFSYRDTTVAGLFDIVRSKNVKLADCANESEASIIQALRSDSISKFRSLNGDVPISSRSTVDGKTLYGHTSGERYASRLLFIETSNILLKNYKQGMESAGLSSKGFAGSILPVINDLCEQVTNIVNTGDSKFHDFMSSCPELLNNIPVAIKACNSMCVSLPVNADIIKNDHEGPLLMQGDLKKSGRHATGSNHCNRGVHYRAGVKVCYPISLPDIAAERAFESAVLSDGRPKEILLPKNTRSGVNVDCSSSFSVADILSIHYDSGATLVFQDVKTRDTVCDASEEAVTDYNRLKHAKVLNFEYDVIPDMRVDTDADVVKLDSRLTMSGRMPAELNTRPYGFLYNKWENISSNGTDESLTDIILSEVIKHKKLIYRLITKEGLAFFPDYDIDVTEITTDLDNKNRKHVRYQLRDLFVDRKKPVLDKRGRLIHTAIKKNYTQGTGLLLKQTSKYSAAGTSINDLSLPALSEIPSLETRPKVLLYQRGVLKDIFIEYVSDGRVGVYWTLHGADNVDTVLRKIINGSPVPMREVSGEFRSETVWINKTGSIYELENMPYAHGKQICTKDIRKTIQGIIMAALYYTYRAIIDSEYSAPSLLIRDKKPLIIPAMLRTDPWYKYISGAILPGISRASNDGRHSGTNSYVMDIYSAEARIGNDVIEASKRGYQSVATEAENFERANTCAIPVTDVAHAAANYIAASAMYENTVINKVAYAPFANSVMATKAAMTGLNNNDSLVLSTPIGEAHASKRQIVARLRRLASVKSAFTRLINATDNYSSAYNSGIISFVNGVLLNRKSILESALDGISCPTSIDSDDFATAVERLLSSSFISRYVKATYIIESPDGEVNIAIIGSQRDSYAANKAGDICELIMQYGVDGHNPPYDGLITLAKVKGNIGEWRSSEALQINEELSSLESYGATYSAQRQPMSPDLRVCLRKDSDAVKFASMDNADADMCEWLSTDMHAALLIAVIRCWAGSCAESVAEQFSQLASVLSSKTLQARTGDAAFSKLMGFVCDSKFIAMKKPDVSDILTSVLAGIDI